MARTKETVGALELRVETLEKQVARLEEQVEALKKGEAPKAEGRPKAAGKSGK